MTGSDAPSNPLPDHPIRNHWIYQLFIRGWRPSLGWMSIAMLALQAWRGDPVMFGAIAAFTLTMAGFRTFEKRQGVA